MKLGITGLGDRLISEGSHTLVLKGVDLKEVADRYSDTEGAKAEKFLWKFQNDKREEYAIWTNLKYGNDKASLTQLLDMLIPGITLEKAAELDTDELVGQRFRARIVHKKNQTTGKVYAQHTFLEPLEAVPAEPTACPAITTAPVELNDPFADEE